MKLYKLTLLFLFTILFSGCAIMMELVGELFLGIEEGAAVEGAFMRGAARGLPKARVLTGAATAGTEAVLSRGMMASEFSAVRLSRPIFERPRLMVKAKNGSMIERAELISEKQIRMLEPPYRVYEMPGRVYTIKNNGVWIKKTPDWVKDGNILYQAEKNQLVMFYYEKAGWSYVGLPGQMIDGWVLSSQLVKADTTGRLPVYNNSVETITIDPEAKAQFERTNWNLNTLNNFKEYRVVQTMQKGNYLFKMIDVLVDTWSDQSLYKVRLEGRYILKNKEWVFDKLLNKQIIESKSKWVECRACQGTGHEIKYTYLTCIRCWASGKVECNNCGDKICPNCNGRRGDPCANCQSGKISCGQCNQTGYIQYAEYKEKCGTCNGLGYYSCDNCRGKGFFSCSNCKGSGRISSIGTKWIECETCNGSGHIRTQLVCKICLGHKQVRNAFD